jgi:hypothetical protein
LIFVQVRVLVRVGVFGALPPCATPSPSRSNDGTELPVPVGAGEDDRDQPLATRTCTVECGATCLGQCGCYFCALLDAKLDELLAPQQVRRAA